MNKHVFTGLQKLTLLDFPGRVACTLFTAGCNFRCPFCHNALLVARPGEQKPYGNDEILGFLKKRQGILDGVAITGGEPTLMPGLYEMIKEIKALGYALKLDTNGTNPALLRKLIEEELVDYVAMDIKNCREKYAETAGLPCDYDLSAIEKSVSILMQEGVDFEFRTTVANPLHAPEDFEKIGAWLAGEEKFFLQQFKDSGDILGKGITAYPEDEMKRFLSLLLPFVPNAQLRGV